MKLKIKLFTCLILLCFIFSVFSNANFSTPVSPNKATLSLVSTKNFFTSLSSFASMPKLATLSNPSSPWQELGPTPLQNQNNVFSWGQAPYSGRISAIAVNQSDPSIIYAGAAQGGVWKTINGGTTWLPLTDNQTSLAIGVMTISPDNTTIYVGTGESSHSIDSYYGIGILKSTNEGNSWQILGSDVFNSSSISGIVVNDSNPNWIVASSTWGSCCNNGLNYGNNINGVGIFYSIDGGQSWSTTNINGQLNNTYLGVAQLLADPLNNSILIASGFRGEIWVSQDSGKTWASSYLTSSFTNPTRVAIGMSINNPNLLFYAVANSSYDLLGIFSYNMATGLVTNISSLPPNTGQTYGPCNNQCWYDLFITADPKNASILYFGSVNLYKSVNGGITWSIIGGSNSGSIIHPDQHAIAFLPGYPSKIFIGNDGGIYSSSDTGLTWNNLNTNLGTLQFNSIIGSPENDSVLIGGTQDNGCENYSNDTTWSLAHTGDGGSALFYNQTTIICNYNSLYVEKSTDGGKTWVNSFNGINTTDISLFYPPMAQDPFNKAVVYIGSNHLYKSLDFGTTWVNITGKISTGDISTISIDPTNSNVLYIGDDAGIIQFTNDGGKNWNQILNTTQMFGYWIPISSIAVDPLNPSHIIVALGNQFTPRLLSSTDMGTKWSVITNLGSIPDNVAVNIVKFNPITDVLFLGGDRGLYYYNGTTFNALGSSLPNAAIFDFTFTHSNYLVVATHGRGVWLNYMTPDITLVSPANASNILTTTLINVSVSDINGLNKTEYNWDMNLNQSFENDLSVISPTIIGTHILRVYAQDIAGNWAKITFIFTTIQPASTSTSTTTITSIPTIISSATLSTSQSTTTNSTANSSSSSSYGTTPTSTIQTSSISLPGFEMITIFILLLSVENIAKRRKK